MLGDVGSVIQKSLPMLITFTEDRICFEKQFMCQQNKDPATKLETIGNRSNLLNRDYQPVHATRRHSSIYHL